MDDFKLYIEVKVTVKPVNPKVGSTQRGPYERNLFVVRESKDAHYVGDKTDIAALVALAVPVIARQWELGDEPPEIVSVDPYSTLAATAVDLNATIDNQGVSTVPTAEYGVTKELGSSQASTVTPDASADDSDTAVEFALTGLTAATQYYYRIKIVSADGTKFSELKTFTTPAT